MHYIKLAAFLTCLSATITIQSQNLSGLPESASDIAKKWAVIFDFDTDSCYPAAAISSDGKINGGLKNSGSITGQCREKDQFLQANTYCRRASVEKNGTRYDVIMFTLYFEKDQATPGVDAVGHRNDWEYALVWLKNGQLTHASTSAHGQVDTKAKESLYFDIGMENHVKVVYHKDGGLTHAFRFAKKDEKPENELNKWVTPTLVEWDQISEPLRNKLSEYDFGRANFPIKDKNFFKEITKNIPDGYPPSAEWNGLPYPPEPAGLITRWLVLDGRDANRDNREVNLPKGAKAKIVVYLPEGVKEKFRFTLKHDKKNANDQSRTDRIGDGAIISGDAYDWPNFGNRIYLGNREDSDKEGFKVSPLGFYVDLVLIN